MDRRKLGPWLCAALLISTPPAHALDIHLQRLPGAPGLAPTEAFDAMEGVQEVLSCGLDVLNTAKNCGLSSVSQVTSPFLVSFDPVYCRLTMRFAIGQLIDGVLGQWLNGALPDLNAPWIGALCLLGIRPGACGSAASSAASRLFRAPAAAPPPQSRTPSGESNDASGLDALIR